MSNSRRILLFLSYSFGIETKNTFKCTPVLPRKLYVSSEQNSQRLYPFSDENGAKTIPSGATHTYKVNMIKGVTPRMTEVPRRGFQKTCRLFFFFADQTAFQQCLFVLNIGKTMAGIDTLLKTNHVVNLITIQNFAAKKLFLSESFQNWVAIESILS